MTNIRLVNVVTKAGKKVGEVLVKITESPKFKPLRGVSVILTFCILGAFILQLKEETEAFVGFFRTHPDFYSSMSQQFVNDLNNSTQRAGSLSVIVAFILPMFLLGTLTIVRWIETKINR